MEEDINDTSRPAIQFASVAHFKSSQDKINTTTTTTKISGEKWPARSRGHLFKATGQEGQIPLHNSVGQNNSLTVYFLSGVGVRDANPSATHSASISSTYAAHRPIANR